MAYKFIAEREGVFAEPASAAAVAGVMKLARNNYFQEGTRVVITLTGSGLKDPEYAMSFNEEMQIVDPTFKSVYKAMKI